MRLYLKKQCLETMKTMDEALEKIEQYIKKNQNEDAALLLEDCQQTAIGIGTVIEEQEGEGTRAVASLEDYCELLYDVHEGLISGKEINLFQISKRFRQILDKTANEINNSLSTQREVVFMPYKASMWDSLESMWRVSVKDEDTITYVMPIPYYDKNPDGSFGARHYEINKFPKDVPVVSYEDYDITIRHPDAVIIHNPYDECNYVTSVDPAYYSKELKKYTDELIYIPYFVLGDIDPDDADAIMGIKHFVLTPGVIHADKVIVESEEMRRAYVKVLVAHSSSGMRREWERKILGLGSPKVERVMNLHYEDFDVPEDWARLIYCDGVKKKVIFYNTSVNATIQKGMTMIKKIRYSLRIFEENKDNVVLLWRPHPLIKATLKAMHPELWEEYNKIVDGYRNAGWGIYDDTANMYHAIAVSDAYYGDHSSVEWLYRKTGKPIMIQNFDILGEDV